METNNQYILQWREHVLKAAEALKNEDFESYESEMGEMDSIVNDMRKDKQLSYEDEDTFGAANNMFESALYNLYITNKPAIKEFMTTIQEDKNLHSQFMFYNTLKQYKKDFDAEKYLNEALSMTMKNIDYKSIKESNKKLYNVLRKHNIKAEKFLNEDDLHFYRLCESMFANPKSLNNLAQINETFNQVASLLESRTKEAIKNDEKVMSVKEFTEKYNKILTESEKEFINTLLDSSNDKKRKELFEEFKQSCIDNIESILKESDSTTQSRLNSLLENINGKEFNRDTVLNDVVKIMEINEILKN